MVDVKEHHCSGELLGGTTGSLRNTLLEAKSACKHDKKCKCIGQYGCEGNGYWLSTGHAIPRKGSCAWIKK